MGFLTQVINNGNLAAMSHHLFHARNYGQHLNNYQAAANESVSYVKQFSKEVLVSTEYLYSVEIMCRRCFY